MDLTESIATIAARSGFDQIQFTGNRYDGRYDTAYEALVSRRGGQDDVAIRMLDRPETEPERFTEDVLVELHQWAEASHAEGILTVHDVGEEPAPWLITDAAEGSLATRGPMDFVDVDETALYLVDAVTTLHNADVVHGGLEPAAVLFRGDAFDDVVEGSPLLDNVGLIHVFRHYFEPSTYLDPRYAAPEYFASRFGTVDHVTDIYQLGAVLYRLFTGEPPYSGSFEELRRAACMAEPPRPSAAGASSRLDDVLTKAMATEKLHRYETIEHLRQDLATIVENR